MRYILTFIVVLFLLFWAKDVFACQQMPETYVTPQPGSVAWTRHVRDEAYIVNRLNSDRQYDTIVFGDSIMGGWRPELLDAMFAGSRLSAARGGATTKDLNRYLDTWPLAQRSPGTVFVGIGRNDVGQDVCPRPVATAVVATLARLRALWPSARIVWQNLTPGGEYLELKDFEIREVNRLVALELPSLNVELLDAWSVIYSRCNGYRLCGLFLAGDAYNGGPVHFGTNGYEAIYNALFVRRRP